MVGLFFLSFFFSFYMMYSLFMVQELTWSTSYSVKKTFNPKQPHASPLHGKNQTPTIHRKNPPCLALKITYPRHLRKQFIETYRRETQTLPQAPLTQKKGLSAEGPTGPTGEDRVILEPGENYWTCGPTLVIISIRSRR